MLIVHAVSISLLAFSCQTSAERLNFDDTETIHPPQSSTKRCTDPSGRYCTDALRTGNLVLYAERGPRHNPSLLFSSYHPGRSSTGLPFTAACMLLECSSYASYDESSCDQLCSLSRATQASNLLPNQASIFPCFRKDGSFKLASQQDLSDLIFLERLLLLLPSHAFHC